jgi:L-ascorbate metabolism protein UlaG (beta-lactamase superfamily)
MLHYLDGILVSHLHYDHLDFPSLEQLGQSTPVVVPRGAGRLLRRRHFERVVEVDTGEEVRIGSLVVRATHADHEGGRGLLKRGMPALGYLIRGSRQIYFAGDTDLFEGMATLAPRLDIALVPIWGWGPSLGPGHLDPRRAAEALRLLRPLLAVPIHWGTYAPVGFGRLQTALLTDPVTEFRRHAAELAPSVEVHVLPLGGSVEI